MTISYAELVQSLASNCCPACAGKKRQNHSFCPDCFYALTAEERKNLWRNVRAGYADAVLAAMRRLR